VAQRERFVKDWNLFDLMTVLGDLDNSIEHTARQLAEVREFTQKLPSLNPSRIELNDWARQGEQVLQAREAAEAARQAEQARGQEPTSRSVDQSSSQERTRIDRSDRDSYSRGR
jgi:hypothetical protein